MKNRKRIRVEDFKRWLKNRTTYTFGCGSEDCPLHDWLDNEMTLSELDALPGWCSRFVGRWDALHDDQNYTRKNGSFALEVLDHVLGS